MQATLGLNPTTVPWMLPKGCGFWSLQLESGETGAGGGAECSQHCRAQALGGGQTQPLLVLGPRGPSLAGMVGDSRCSLDKSFAWGSKTHP